MTTESDVTLAAIDKAYQEHIGKLYANLMAASESETKSGVALERFTAGLKRARERREAAIECVE